MYTRELERLVRSLQAQKVDREYIRHYLKETYQVDDKIVEQVLERCGAADPAKTGKGGGKGPASRDQQADRRSRQGF